jgi:hypothetical protein
VRLYRCVVGDRIARVTKYLGHQNARSLIRASFSSDGRWVILGFGRIVALHHRSSTVHQIR